MSLKWENIYLGSGYEGTTNTIRAKVFGGWLLNNCTYNQNRPMQSESMVFIPDPDHKWKID